MRTDLKIGLVVGFVLILIVLIYFVSQDEGARRKSVETEMAPATRPSGSVGTVELKSGRIAKKEETDSPAGQEPLKPVAPPSAEARREVEDRPVIVPRPAPLYETIPPRGLGLDRGTSLAGSPATRPAIRSIPRIPVSPTAKAKPTEKPMTYTVQSGDRGFWDVAKKVYGHGKHWPLVARANPGVDSNNIRPGKVLVTPPLPGKTTRREPASRKPAMRTATTTGPVYIVQPGDNGFWGVAEKVYGDGRYWELIAGANPKADTRKLRAGQKLVIPPVGDFRPGAGSAGRTGKPEEPSSGDDRPIFD